jgi:Na+-driven multidrug efflux pump
MLSNIALSLGVLVVPVFVGITFFQIDIYTCWIFATAYASLLGLNFFLRFLTGKWNTMQVIEEETATKSEF